MSNNIYRYILICATADRADCNQLAVDLFAGDENQRNTFSVPLVNEQNEITHFGCSFVASEAMRDAMSALFMSAMGQGKCTSLKFYRSDLETNILQSSNSVSAQNKIGSEFSYDDALSDLNLQRQQIEML